MTITRRHLLGGAATTLFALGCGRLGADRIAHAGRLLTLDHPEYGRLGSANTPTPAEWIEGGEMWSGGYCDGPYMVRLPGGGLISTLTVNESLEEGNAGQHTIILSSTDDGETWTTVAEMEPASAPESSWGMPWLHQPSGRLYVFYTFNVDNVRDIGGSPRADCIGALAYRSSIDGGATWTERRHLNIPVTDIDIRNPFAGTRQLFWLTGHPVQHGEAAYLGLSKIADMTFNDSEAFVVKAWETEPGVLACVCSSVIRNGGPVNEEPSPLVFDDGVINVAFRTVEGFQGEAWSADDGDTWAVDWARDAAGLPVKQPRAKAAQFILPDGRIFLWGHNNDVVPGPGWETFSGPRNPVYYRIGTRSAGRIVWGPARLLLWDSDPETRISYPSIVADDDEVLVAATDKATARVFRFPYA